MKLRETIMKLVFLVAACCSVLAVALICIFLFMNGVPAIFKIGPLKFLTGTVWKPGNNIFGILPMIVGSICVTGLAILMGVPVAILTSVFLSRYCPKKFYGICKSGINLMAGIPSIVFGLFGMLFFVTALHWGMSLLAGACTLVIMVLPLIMRTSEEALKAVPDSYREASFGLGAGKLRTIFTIVLPSAVPGILAGIILAIGRIIGETAALLYTSGTVAQVPNLMGSGRTLALHMYVLSSEGLHMNQASATAVVILLFVLLINGLSGMVAKCIAKG